MFTGVRVIPARGRVEARGKFAKKRTDRVDKSLINKVEGQQVSKEGETDVDVGIAANGDGNTGKRDQEENVATSPSKRVKLDTEVEAEVAVQVGI